nr:polymeric immunoglobulin receptor-like [Misgurnus anguillicaudatus]
MIEDMMVTSGEDILDITGIPLFIIGEAAYSSSWEHYVHAEVHIVSSAMSDPLDVLAMHFLQNAPISVECRTVTGQTGESVIIPCHYESLYNQHKKYWCYHSSGSYRYCSILAYANETKGDVSVIDHPDQSLFTVTMRDLQDQNTGYYWCGVEVEGITFDVTEWFYIKIQSAPDVSVMSSSVTVDEGGNISVQCLYTSTYKNKHKQWCRYKDKSCYTSQNASVKISDDGRGSLTVVMSGLMKSDSGWYYCSVGDLQASVQLAVNDPPVSTGDLQTSAEFTDAEPMTG